MSQDPLPEVVDSAGTAVALRPDRSALTRDFLTFAAKLLLNASVEVVMLPLAALGYAVDMLSGRSGKRSRFKAVMRLGRRWDAWLRVFRPASQLTKEPAALGQSAVSGADHLIASVEHMILSGDLPTRYRNRVEDWAKAIRKSTEPSGADPLEDEDP